MKREELEQLKRQELQALCKENGCKASGTNLQMIDRLDEHFNIKTSKEHHEYECGIAIEQAEQVEIKAEVVCQEETENHQVENEENNLFEDRIEQNIEIPENSIISETLIVEKSNSIEPEKKEAEKVNSFSVKRKQVGGKENQIARKKFDLKESLKKPLPYKPYTGPIKPGIMFEWISQLGKKSALFMTKYGAAWLITVYVLSFLNLGMIYLALMLVQIDLVELLKYYEFSGNIIYLAEKGGNIALAYALNRFLAPIRLWIALLLMPFLAPKLNKIWGKISGKDK